MPRDLVTFKMRTTASAIRSMTCKEAECSARAYGWKTILPSPAKIEWIEWLRAGKSGKHFREASESPGMVTFYFSEGQDCFQTHTEREARFDIGRKEGGRVLMYESGDHFVDDSGRHLEQLKEKLNG
jgi:hypothetical protein